MVGRRPMPRSGVSCCPRTCYLDAVAGQRRYGRRRHRAGLRLLLSPNAPAAATCAGGGAPDQEDREHGDDEEGDAAPAPQLALALG